MKVLLDTCVWGGARPTLISLGYDVVWTGDWPRDPGDEEIIRFAFTDERILITLDKDFGELAVVRNLPHFGIMRLVGFAASDQASVCDAVLSKHGAELLAGAIITAEPGRVRIRSANG